jgi:hypothetical protein
LIRKGAKGRGSATIQPLHRFLRSVQFAFDRLPDGEFQIVVVGQDAAFREIGGMVLCDS